MKCEHGNEPFNHHLAKKADPDWILENYSACDCCDGLMHQDTPYQLCRDGRTLCFDCRDTEESETLPEGWN